MQKHASFRWLATIFLALIVACSPLAMQTESAEEFGVASEQSGKVLGRACVQDGAVNGIQSLCTEDSAGRMGR